MQDLTRKRTKPRAVTQAAICDAETVVKRGEEADDVPLCCKAVYDDVAVDDIVGTLVDACRAAVIRQEVARTHSEGPPVPTDYIGIHTWLAASVLDGVLTQDLLE